MGKGMSLDEFKNALSSEATIENEHLKNEIKDLEEKLKKSEETIMDLRLTNHQYEQWCRQLGNRCFVHTFGVMCVHCGVECCDHTLSYDDLDAIAEYMRKNKLPRTPESYEKVTQFMCDRRNKSKEIKNKIIKG